MQRRIEKQIRWEKTESPDDIFFHGSLFQSFHFVPEPIFAFWKMMMQVKNKKMSKTLTEKADTVSSSIIFIQQKADKTCTITSKFTLLIETRHRCFKHTHIH